MVTKRSLTFVTLLAFIFVIGLGSATLTLTNTSVVPSQVAHTAGSFSVNFNLTNTIENLTSLNFTLSPAGSSISPVLQGTSILVGETKTFTLTVPVTQYSSSSINLVVGVQNGTDVASADSFSSTIPITSTSSLSLTSVDASTNQTLVTVTNNGNVALSGITLNIVNSTYIKFNVPSPSLSINAGQSAQFTVNIDSSLLPSSKIGPFAHAMSANASGVSATGTLTFIKPFCKAGEQGTLLQIEGIDDDDDFEWEPLMDVNVEVEVSNNDDSSKRTIVKLRLYDLTEGEFVEFYDGEDELEETIRIADDDEEVFSFNFKLPATIDPANDYRLYVKAYESGEEETECKSEMDIEVEISSDYEVLMDEFESPSFLICGATNTISFRVHNLGLGDEQKMRVNLFNSELGLDLYTEQFELDEGEDADVSFNFAVPEGKEAKSYRFTFSAEYDYRESSDAYRDSENLDVVNLRVDGDKCKATIIPSVSAVLDSETETIVGKDLVVKVTIANPLNLNASQFIIALEGYESWASSATIDQSTFNLGSGESKTITITFKPTKSGSQEFTIKTIYGSRVAEQKVNVTIEGRTSYLSKALAHVKENSTRYLIVAIFLVIIVIILVLLVRFINSRQE